MLRPGKLGAFVAEMDFGTARSSPRALHDAVDAALLGYLPPAVAAACGEACAAWQARRPRLGRATDRRPPARRRDHGSRGRDRALLPARRAGDPADARLHAVPRRPGPPRSGDDPDRDGPRRRALRVRPRRPRPRVRRRRSTCSCCATRTTRSAGSWSADELVGDRRGRRPPRRTGVRRRDPRSARVRRSRARAVRLDLDVTAGAHRHRHVGLEGVEPPRPEVRPADPDATTPTGPRLDGARARRHPRRVDARRHRQHRRLRRRRPVARRRPRLPRRQPPPARRAARRAPARGRLHAARGHVPGLARLPRAGPAGRAAEFFLERGRRRARRRGPVRPGRCRVRAPELRHDPPILTQMVVRMAAAVRATTGPDRPSARSLGAVGDPRPWRTTNHGRRSSPNRDWPVSSGVGAPPAPRPAHAPLASRKPLDPPDRPCTNTMCS